MPKRIYIGAGHSGVAPSVYKSNLSETEIATNLRDNVAEEFRKRNIIFLMDGSIGENLNLSSSIRIARQADGPRVEFHVNAGVSTARGVEALSTVERRPLASDLAAATAKILQIPLRGHFGWKPDTAGQHPRLGFCREGGGVVLELFFSTNPNDVQAFLMYRTSLAAAIADVLIEHSEK